MKILKIFLNFFGVVLAVFLSILLLTFLILTPVISSATNVITPKTLQKILTSIDYKEIISENKPDVEINEENTGLPADTIESLMQSDTAKDIIELYTNDVSAMLSGENNAKSFTPEAIKDIINDNIDEISDITFELTKEENPQITKEEIKTEILKDVDKSAEELSKLLPDTEELINVDSMDEQTLNALKTLADGSMRLYIIGTVLILSLLIYGCRFMRFKGFMWLAVVYILGAVFAFVARIASNTLWRTVIADSLPFSPDIIAPAVSIALSQFIIIGIVLLVCAAAFITAFVFGRKNLKKQNTVLSEAPVFIENSKLIAEPETEISETPADNNQTL